MLTDVQHRAGISTGRQRLIPALRLPRATLPCSSAGAAEGEGLGRRRAAAHVRRGPRRRRGSRRRQPCRASSGGTSQQPNRRRRAAACSARRRIVSSCRSSTGSAAGGGLRRGAFCGRQGARATLIRSVAAEAAGGRQRRCGCRRQRLPALRPWRVGGGPGGVGGAGTESRGQPRAAEPRGERRHATAAAAGRRGGSQRRFEEDVSILQRADEPRGLRRPAAAVAAGRGGEFCDEVSFATGWFNGSILTALPVGQPAHQQIAARAAAPYRRARRLLRWVLQLFNTSSISQPPATGPEPRQ